MMIPIQLNNTHKSKESMSDHKMDYSFKSTMPHINYNKSINYMITQPSAASSSAQVSVSLEEKINSLEFGKWISQNIYCKPTMMESSPA